MAIDEHSRHGLYLRLEQVLGPQEAATLMEHLPPVGWADVATKQDLDHLSLVTKKDLEIFSQSLMASFRGELLALQRHMVFAMTSSMVSIAAISFAIAQLI